MKRAFIMVLDSFGIGASKDADKFGDAGSDTLGHIAEACCKGEADKGRKGPLHLPNLTASGPGESGGRVYRKIPVRAGYRRRNYRRLRLCQRTLFR